MPLTIDLTDRVAVVTAAGAGLGRAICVRLARCGAHVVVADVVSELAERTAQMVNDAGGRAVAVTMDAMDPEQVRLAVNSATDHFQRLDILVNNAGGVSARAFPDQSEASWRRHIDLNLVSALTATSTAVPLMRRGGRGGAIINVASIEAVRAAPMFAVYAACKAGLTSFGKTMAVELGADNIRVNTIAPDFVATPGLRGLRGADLPEEVPPRPGDEPAGVRGYVPLGREGRAEECGDLVAFLASDLAAYVTGATIPLDGGTGAAAGWIRSPDDDGWNLGALPVTPRELDRG